MGGHTRGESGGSGTHGPYGHVKVVEVGHVDSRALLALAVVEADRQAWIGLYLISVQSDFAASHAGVGGLASASASR